MGTRADFYIGRGEQAEWLGSIGWDGYPDGIDKELFEAATEAEFRERLAKFAASRDDWTKPEQGWPWPWNDSQMTDYAYAFDQGKVHAFNSGWFDPLLEEPEEKEDCIGVFPDMKDRQNVTMGKRSGLITFGM